MFMVISWVRFYIKIKRESEQMLKKERGIKRGKKVKTINNPKQIFFCEGQPQGVPGSLRTGLIFGPKCQPPPNQTFVSCGTAKHKLVNFVKPA